MYGYDSARTGHVTTRDLPGASAEPRRFSQTGSSVAGGGSVEAPPVIDGTIAYVAGDVRVEARDIETGDRLWETDPDDAVSISSVLTCGTLYVCTINETLALDPADGTILWRADTGAHSGPSVSPAAMDDTLFVVGWNVTALDADSGEKRWTVNPDHAVHGVAVADRVYVGGGSNDGGGVSAFTRYGDEWWRTTEPGQIYTAPAVADDIVFAVSNKGTLSALNASDGSLEWQADVESGIHQPPAVADGRVVVEAGNGTRTMAFDAETGNQLWTFKTGVSTGGPIIVGDRVLATGANTGIHLLDAGTGDRVRHWEVGNVGSQPVVAERRLFYRAWNVSDIFVIE